MENKKLHNQPWCDSVFKMTTQGLLGPILVSSYPVILMMTFKHFQIFSTNKGNNKIAELRTIFQGKVKTRKYKNQSTTGKL